MAPQASARELVEVAEAIYVPPQQEVAQDAAVPIINKRPAWGSLPSQDAPGKQLWLQLSSFRNRDDALNFWRQLQQTAPETAHPSYRVRVIRPYTMSAAGHVALRIGPTTSRKRANALCAVAGAAAKGLRCNMVREFGTSRSYSTAKRAPIAKTGGYKRYGMRNRSYTPRRGMVTTHWVQLGSYQQTTHAREYLMRLQDMYPNLVGDVDADITTPPNSSAGTRVYRLQLGPFSSDEQARERCSALRQEGVSCLVISRR